MNKKRPLPKIELLYSQIWGKNLKHWDKYFYSELHLAILQKMTFFFIPGLPLGFRDIWDLGLPLQVKKAKCVCHEVIKVNQYWNTSRSEPPKLYHLGKKGRSQRWVNCKGLRYSFIRRNMIKMGENQPLGCPQTGIFCFILKLPRNYKAK